MDKGIAMKGLPSRVSEHVLIWLAVLTAIVVTVYRLAVATPVSAPLMDTAWEGLPGEDWVTNGLLLWSVTLLLAACFLWRAERRHHRELARIVGSVSPDVLAVVTPDRRISLCNPAVKAMFGWDPSEIVGRTTDVLYPDRRTTDDAREVYHAVELHGFHLGSATGIRRNGETFPLEIVTGGLDGRKGAVVLLRDITERKRAEQLILGAKEELEASYQRLKDLEALRDNLTHMVVHDIKHAVSGIGVSLDLLKRDMGGALSPAAGTLLGSAEGFTADVLEMVRALLDISRMEAGQMALDLTACNLGAVAREAAEVAETLAVGKGVRLVLPEDGLQIKADRELLRRIMANLLTNAVRFAPDGSVVDVRAFREGDSTRVEVADDGPGVDREYHARIFQKFGRVEMQRHGADHSTGLGLTFCKLAVETHGGRIGVESPSPRAGQGRGSIFWFTLPN
jgi:PAS domain S-box-containing protein